MKGFRYDVIKDYKMYDVLRPVVGLFNKLSYKITYVGKENVPAEGNYILAVNHVHGADPFIAGMGLGDRGVHFISKKELFRNRAATWFFTNMNAFPVERGKADRKAVGYAINLLKNGKILGIFPEGTRSRTGEFGEPKNGTVYFALKTKSDILPTSLCYDDNGKKPIKTTVRYGKLIKFEDLHLPEKPTRQQMKDATNYVMDKIKELYYMGQAAEA